MNETGVRWLVLGLLCLAAVLGFAAPGDAMRSTALLCLAAIPASAAFRGWWRVPLGLLVAVVPLAVVLASADVEPVATVAAAVAMVAGGLLAWRGRRWGDMSMRFSQHAEPHGEAESGTRQQRGQAGSAGVTEDPRELWNALSRGDDPTSATETASPQNTESS